MKNDKLDSIQTQQHRVSCTRDCRIIIYQLGDVKSIDRNIICRYFSLRDISRCRLIDQYFNKLICDKMNDLIWNDICHALQFIPMKIKEKETLVNNNRDIATAETKASEIFWYSCKDNGVEIGSLLKLFEKNGLFKTDQPINHQEKSKFVNKLNHKCGHFLKQWKHVKTTSK